MRKFIDGNGNDSTAAAVAYLKAHRNLILPDLYVINPSPNLLPENQGPTSLVGPYHALTIASNGESGYFDSTTRKLYWVDSIIDAGDVYMHCHDDGHCGTSESFFNTFHSYKVVINILGSDLELTQITTDPLPCAATASPTGQLIVTSDTFYIGAMSGNTHARWFIVNLDGSFTPCLNVNVWGRIENVGDDGWGGNTFIGGGFSAFAVMTSMGLIHIDGAGDVFIGIGSTSAALTLPNTSGVTMAACSDGTNFWVLSNGTGGNPQISQIFQTPSGPAITNYALPNSPANTHNANSIQYYSVDDSLLFWLGDVLYKWDIGTQTIVASASVAFAGSGPVAGGALPNGVDFYDPVSLAKLVIEGDGTDLPAYNNAWDFQHWYDPVGAVLWLQTNDSNSDGKDVYGVPVSVSGQPANGPFLLTDYPSPLKWDYKGTFQPATISRGEVESKIGFEADTLDITWSPKDTDTLCGGAVTALEAFGFGLFDNGVVEVWRCCMPKPGDQVGSPATSARLGDCNTFGATLMFSGRIGDLAPDRLKAKISVISRMELLNVNVPTNLIEPTNVFATYSTGQIPTGGAGSFSVVAGSTTSVVYADPATDADLYDGGYLIFARGAKLAGVYARIMKQEVVSGHNAFYLAEALPVAPDVGNIIVAFVPTPLDDSGSKYGGFRWVPMPDNSAVVI